MNVLQGRYLKRVNSKSGKLKGLKIKTEDDTQTVYLPKALRAIAQEELALGDSLRIWTAERKKVSKKALKKGSKKGSKKNQDPSLWALQLIPLSPKDTVTPPPQAVQKAKKKAAKKMTVQLCQKKNCCKRGGTELWSTFESANEAAKTEAAKPEAVRDVAAANPFKLEAVGCLGGCKHGPNLRFLPDNVKHYHVQPKDVSKLLAKHSRG